MPGALSFRVALAAVALHTMTDALVGLEPGVSATDHWAAAVVPTAILLATAVLYPRVRAGAQGAAALSIGVLSLVGFALALAGGVEDGWDASAVTGLLLGPAGALLCGLGLLVLWRSRKATGRRYLRRTLIGVAAAVLAFELLLPIALALVATHRPAGPPFAPDLGRPSESVSVVTGDGLELTGSYAPSRNGAAIVVFPDREGTAAQARMLAGAGFGVLALDMRGYGGSDGDPNAYGWGSSEDIAAGVQYLAARPGVDPSRIGGLGLSVGGEQMIEAAAADDGPGAVVSEGAGERSVRETLLFGPAAALVIPQSAVLTAAVSIFSGDLPPEPLDELARSVSPRALLLIEAEDGQGGEQLNEDYYEAAGEPKDRWVVPGAGHTGGIDAKPRDYRQRVVGFFEEALAPRR